MQNFHSSEALLAGTLVQIIIIVLVARAAGYVAQRLGQPRVIGEIIGGLLLGPSFLGHFFPGLHAEIFSPATVTPMSVLSQIGLILLMFEIGCEFNFSLLQLKQNRYRVGLVAVASISVSLLSGIAFGWYCQPQVAPAVSRIVFALFVGVAIAITALPILGRILRELELTNSEIGVVAISAAAINDVVGWVLLALITAYASAELSGGSVALQIGGLVLFAVILWQVGQRVVDRMVRSVRFHDGLPTSLLASTVCLIFLCGLVTQKLGIFTIFGGFACGVLFHRHHNFVRAWQGSIRRFVLAVLLPIFFTNTGLRTNLLGLQTFADWLLCGEIFLLATVTKIVPVYFAARSTGFSVPQSGVLGTLMNTRALMELIVLNIGYTLGVLPQNIFTMLVLMAVGSTIMCGPLVRALLTAEGYVGKLQEG